VGKQLLSLSNKCVNNFVNGQFWLNLSSKTRGHMFWGHSVDGKNRDFSYPLIYSNALEENGCEYFRNVFFTTEPDGRLQYGAEILRKTSTL